MTMVKCTYECGRCGETFYRIMHPAAAAEAARGYAYHECRTLPATRHGIARVITIEDVTE